MGAHFEDFEIGMGEMAFLYYVIIAVLALVFIYLFYLLIKVTIVKQGKIRKEWKRFYNVCERKRLNSHEIDFLKELIKKYNILRPIYIVRHLETFNRYIFREVYKYRDLETKRRENFITFVTILRKKLGFANFELLDELTSSREISEGTYTKTYITIANIKKNFKSKVIKVDEDGIVLSVPDPFMAEEPLRENLPVEFNFVIEGDAEYTFNSVTYKVIPGPPGFICIDHSRNFTRIQKRKYDRVDVEIPFKYFFLSPEQTKDFLEIRKFALTKEIKYETGVIKNISAGGMFFDNETEIEIGTLIAITIKLGDEAEEIKNIIGRVIRIIENEDDTYRTYIHFVKIKGPHKNQVIHLVFEKKNLMKREKKLKLKMTKKLTPA